MNKSMLKEKRAHGTPHYPVSVYVIYCPPGEPLLDLHWHDELEFLMVTEGNGVFRVDVDDYAVKAGEAIFVNSGMLHSGYIPGQTACSFKAVVFHPQLFNSSPLDAVFEKYILPLIRKQYTVPAHLTHDSSAGAELLSVLQAVFAAHTGALPTYELAAKGLLHLAMGKLLSLGKPASQMDNLPTPTDRIERLKTVLEYIETHFREPVRLHDLSGLVSMSEAYFCRFFKEITNRTPVEYLNRRRAQHAAMLLKETTRKITDIALDAGFNNASYFIGVFKRYYGCTPAEYRCRLPAPD